MTATRPPHQRYVERPQFVRLFKHVFWNCQTCREQERQAITAIRRRKSRATPRPGERTMKSLLCRLLGHPDSLIQWGAWKSDEECGRYRLLTERCARCDAVIATRVQWEVDLPTGRAS